MSPSYRTVTASQLSANGRDRSVLSALRLYRPQFLRSRGTVPMVTIDGSPLTDLSILETLSISAISEVRLLRASSALGYPAVTPDGSVVIRDVLYVRSHRMPGPQ